jgi:hypothetical protein
LAESGAFQSLAEFGIALAGFTSIVIVFGRRDGDFHPADRFRVFTALVLSLGAAFLALFPVGLDLVGLSAPMVWRVSSVVLVAYIGWYSVIAEIRPAETRVVLSSHLRNVFRTLRAAAILASILNATGFFFSPQAGVYFFAVLCPLAIGAIVFVRVVFIRPAV